MEIIILTKSSKYQEFCVAGINTVNGKWVRLVTEDEQTHGALTHNDLICDDGHRIEVLDVVNVAVNCDFGTDIQPENVLIDRNKRIQFVRRTSLDEVLQKHPAEIHKYLLGNRYCYIKEQYVRDIGYSLALIKVRNLVINHATNDENKTKTKASFEYLGNTYTNMSVTDFNYYSVPEGTTIDSAYIVTSIGTPHNEKYYKFVAHIFE